MKMGTEDILKDFLFDIDGSCMWAEAWECRDLYS